MFSTHVILAVSYWGLCFHSARLCNAPDILFAKSTGDIIIGGLFPINTVGSSTNRSQPGPIICSDFRTYSFITAHAMIYSIDQINNSTLLPGLKLGYEIYDSCSDVLAAIEATTRFLSNSENCVELRCNYTDYIPNVKAVIGTTFSEVSIVVARILNRYLVPQVAYAASAEQLSDKEKFASFLRTVPNDSHQTKALAELIKKFKWNWIAVMASNDAYGRDAMNSFILNAENLSICIEFAELITIYQGQQQDERIKEIAQKIKNSTSKVAVVFMRGSIVALLFKQLIALNVTKTWIASDSWSNSRIVADLDDIEQVGMIIGINFKVGEVQNFDDYLQKLNQSSKNKNAKFMDNYKKTKCVESKDDITECVKNSFAYRVNLAVRAIAYALQKKLSCESGQCSNPSNFAPWQLLSFLKEVNFTYENVKFQFDKLGDFRDGYDVINWKMVNRSIKFEIIGSYDLQTQKTNITNSFLNTVKVMSNCSRTCQAGERKVSSKISCCHTCKPCQAGQYSNTSDSNECDMCPEKQWSVEQSSTCQDRVIEFLRWDEVVSIVLMMITCLGILVICVIFVLFIMNNNTPAVKAAGGWLSYLMLFSLLLSFISIFFFIGKPNNYKCQIRQPIFGISFTCCISCILVKSFRIILAFTFNPILRKKLRYVYKPVANIIIVTGIQVVICTTWLLLKSPFVHKEQDSGFIFLSCQEGSDVGFGIMLSYIYLLAFICFMLAFKGRKVPDNYNEAKFITFSVLIFLLVWILFIPVYVNEKVDNKNRPAIEVVAILVSTYGILCCQFGPTSYIVCFKNEGNVEAKYLVQVREHLKRKGQFVIPNPNIGAENSTTESAPSVPCRCVVYQNPNNKDQINVLMNEQTRALASSSLRKRRGSW